MRERQIIFVLGMSRSGTSVLTRVISLCGAHVPGPVHGASPANPSGHWEPLAALELNDEFLFRHDSTWYDPALDFQTKMKTCDDGREKFIRDITLFLQQCSNAPVLVIKDPRITSLSEFWFAACCRAGFAVKVVVSVRHPSEVVASLRQRDGTSEELGNVLWLKYNLLAERNSRGVQRAFVEYTNVLHDWRREIRRIADCLAVELKATDELAVDSFVNQALYQQRNDGTVNNIFGEPWTARVYDALSNSARGVQIDIKTLDAVFAAFSASQRTFLNSFHEFRGRFSPQSLIERRHDARSSAEDQRRSAPI